MLPKPRKYIPGALASQYQGQTLGVMTLSKLVTGCKVRVIIAPPLPQQYHCFAVDPYRVTAGKQKGRGKRERSQAQIALDNLTGETWG
jgi:hypothetical protein